MKNDLFQIMQNSAIGGIALHSFILGYYKVAKHKENKKPYPKISYLFYVLPIVYNERAMEIFKSSDQLFTAISKDNGIVLGLQERANKMSQQTFDSLNIGFSKKIFTYNKESQTIELIQGFKTQKIQFSDTLHKDNDLRKIQDSSYKLGSIFAKKNEKNIQIELNIRF